MKKLLALVLCLASVFTMFVGCKGNNSKDGDEGPTIPMYFTNEVANFDPAYGNLDDSAMKIMSLIYEGLFKYDSNGKVVKAQAKSIKKLDKPSKDYYAIEITLKNTSWSDGTPVLASDYIYAWKRILESSFRGEAANMLFCIKNARKVHDGDATIDDLGITDVSKRVIRIEFEGKTDYNQFYEYLASPMLVPLREFQVGRVPNDWSSNASIMVSNGAFMVRSYVAGTKLLLERNSHYHGKENVKPFRIEIKYGYSETDIFSDEELYQSFLDGNIVYNGEIPLDKRAELLKNKKVTVKDTMSVMSCIFDTTNELLSDPQIRRALSMAIDRNEITKILTFASPAKGLIAEGVFNTANGKKKASFRDKGETLIAASADLDAAKELLRGKTKGELKLVVRDNDADIAVAEYIKGVWKELGYTVKIQKLGVQSYRDSNELNLVKDKYIEAYNSGSFDVILVDYLMFSTDAFSNLASFALPFAGGAMDMTVTDGNYQLAPHVSGYSNPEYDALIEAAYAETNASKRAELLHQAEKMLMNDMPIMPLVQLKNAYQKNGDLSGVKTNYYGFYTFNSASLKNRSKYEEAKD